jgi:DNA repair photolyase
MTASTCTTSAVTRRSPTTWPPPGRRSHTSSGRSWTPGVGRSTPACPPPTPNEAPRLRHPGRLPTRRRTTRSSPAQAGGWVEGRIDPDTVEQTERRKEWTLGRHRPPPKARGAVSNPAGRYERLRYAPPEEADGAPEDEPAPLETTVTPERVRGIITRNDSPDVPFDQSVNPYRGCEHGCVYCFARSSHAYLGLSPGLDFESRLFSKPDAPEQLARELGRPRYRVQPIALGANTDPYQPVERRLSLTRRLLEVLAAHEHPFTVATKSDLVLRDLDLLAAMADRRLAAVLVSVTTVDPALARRMEPRAPTPSRRITAIRRLVDAGVPVSVLASPMIPGLNDAEMETILEASAGAGARGARYILVRLPREVKDLFSEWLESEYPDRASRVLSLVRQTRGGKLYDSRFGARVRGEGPYAEVLEKRFRVACGRLGLSVEAPPLDTTRFRVPRDDDDRQGSLFE